MLQLTSKPAAEQMIREALANQVDDLPPPRIQINDDEELAEYLLRKRAEFENSLRRQRMYMNTWVKYARFEEGLGEFKRARSIFERALSIDYRLPTIWLKYAEMEMRHKHVNHARNVWERAVHLLPRIDQLWYKYAYMEEMLGYYVGARKILTRWLDTQPQEHAYVIAARFEERMGEIDNARAVMHRLIQAHPQVSSFIKVAKFEEKLRNRSRARQIYETAISELGAAANNEAFFLEFTKFELRCREIERARILYKYAITHLNKSEAPRLHQAYVDFEKQHGSSDNIEFVILNKRRQVYERQLEENPMNYDIWFDYIKLEEEAGDVGAARKLYARALQNKPPSQEKRHWRRYIYLWLFWAVFEETQAADPVATRKVFEDALNTVPHKAFSFSKLWTLYAQFELRQLDIEKARKIFGVGLGKLGSPKLYESYIEMEMQLGDIERCRKLYEKYIERHPNHPNAWAKYAEFERSLEETTRSRAIMELAIEQQVDMPEVLWKAYIDLEIEAGDTEQVRDLFKRLLDKTKHVKVWLTAAQYEVSIESFEGARKLFADGEKHFKETGDKESRLLLLEAWLELELQHGTEETCTAIRAKLPRKVKMRRQLRQFGDEEPAQEEYLDYVFPEDEDEGKALKILEFAQRWKQGISQ
eukprot:CAMPEP_0204916656 /NCGR_PEP_ID=MMETSP1397-20131031/14423_1 /ASSEMBLY_ACC=CAM_ASM_000891 /TAXON_ID=49980 /ORGANISM="Climacostomum Climacostomum virens, Strain Stock W-24" /LENGTH=645 /DNA_ID=CAMNT_0052089249 /DNA_START=64 /DNA_END=2000 /DNA_ORIENTATION=+